MKRSLDKVIRGREWKTKKAKYSYEEVKEMLAAEGYTLCQEEYKNSKTKMKIKCKNGHEREMRLDNWLAGHRCATCQKQKDFSPKWRVARKEMEKYGYKIVVEPDKNTANAKLACPRGHYFEISVYNWLRGNRCPKCGRREKLQERFNNINQRQRGHVPSSNGNSV